MSVTDSPVLAESQCCGWRIRALVRPSPPSTSRTLPTPNRSPNPKPSRHFTPASASPAPGTAVHFSLSLTVLSPSWRWNSVVLVFLCLKAFHVAATVRLSFLACADTCCFYPFVHEGTLGLFPLFSIVNHVGCTNTWVLVSSASVYIPRRGIAESYGSSTFNFLRNHCTVLHSDDCTILLYILFCNTIFSVNTLQFSMSMNYLISSLYASVPGFPHLSHRFQC